MVMSLTQFRTLCRENNLTLGYARPDQNGGWSDPKQLTPDVIIPDTIDLAHVDGILDAANLLDLFLQEVAVLALRDGQPVGAWSHAGWFIGSYIVTVDEAYRHVFQ